MSIQEIEAAIGKLPPDQVRELSAWLEEHLAEIAENRGQDREAIAQTRHRLADEAGKHWQGGDGLDYQERIRAEWDAR